MERHRAPTAVDCEVCGKTLSRKADLSRHMKLHAINRNELMHACPHLGCKYKTLQYSNLVTHLNVHSRERPHRCPADGCDFSSSDPGSLTRHRKEAHGYEPRATSGRNPSAVTRRAARQQRRISPYSTASTSSSGSVPYHTPHPQASRENFDRCSPSSPPADAPVKERVKSASAAYSTVLISKLPGVADPRPTPNSESNDSLLFTSGSFTAWEAPTMVSMEPPVPEPVGLYAVGVPARPISNTTSSEVSDAELNKFLAQFDDWCTGVAPTHDEMSFLTSMVQHAVPNGIVPTAASSIAPMVQYRVDDTFFMPSPPSFPLYHAPSPIYPYPLTGILSTQGFDLY